MELLSADRIAQLTGDQLDSLLEQIRIAESQLKAVQMRVLREVDRRQVRIGDGMRTLEDWMIGRLDVARESARKLATVARADSADLDTLLADGVAFDRVAELAAAGETDPHLELDLPGLRSELARRIEVTAADEQASFDDRFVAIQPSLDESAWSLWGRLPALEGKQIADTLDQIADELPVPPHGHRESRATRRADALFVVCDRRGGNDGSDVGSPVSQRSAATAIPPATRRFVLWRDGGICTADGCSSSYRLQPHHIIERAEGGGHQHTNLTSLCWYHHHVVVHGRGFRIDPTSPTRRRRSLSPAKSNSDPPI